MRTTQWQSRATAFLSIAVLSFIAIALPLRAAAVPYTYVDNRIMIECTIDGQGPFAMILDTGAPDITITPETAHRLHIITKAAGTTVGAGNKPVQIGAARVRTLSIGNLTLANQDVGVLDLSEIRTKLHFPRLDGIIGYPILKRFATYVDVDNRTISFENALPALPAHATTTPFKGVLPEINARIDGIATSVLVDSGDRSSLTLFGPFAKAHKYFGRHGARSNVVTGFGLGGPIRSDVFRVASLEVLGGHLQKIVTRASRQTGGVFTSSAFGGSIGTGVLRRFNIVYDYPHHRIITWPSKYFSAPDRFVPPPTV